MYWVSIYILPSPDASPQSIGQRAICQSVIFYLYWRWVSFHFFHRRRVAVSAKLTLLVANYIEIFHRSHAISEFRVPRQLVRRHAGHGDRPYSPLSQPIGFRYNEPTLNL